MAKKEPIYRTTRDIVIPAGTKVEVAPTSTRRMVPFSEVLIAITKDVTADFTFATDEGLKTGLIKETGE